MLKDLGLRSCQCNTKENRKEAGFGVLYIDAPLRFSLVFHAQPLYRDA